MDSNSINQTPIVPTTPVAPMQPTKMGNGTKIAVIISVAIAICGLGFGIFGMTKASEKKTDLSDLEVQVKTETGETTTIETPEITTADNDKQIITIPQNQVSKPENLNKYIYITQWGIKIKFPTTMTITGYRYTLKENPVLYVYAQNCSDGGCQYLPDFANQDINKDAGLVAVTRVHSSVPEEERLNIGTKVTTIGDYDYYACGPQTAYSEDPTEMKEEVDTVNKLVENLNNPNNYSEI